MSCGDFLTHGVSFHENQVIIVLQIDLMAGSDEGSNLLDDDGTLQGIVVS